LSLIAAVTMAALSGALIAADVVLALTLPSSIPDSLGVDRQSALSAVPEIGGAAIAFLLTTRRPRNRVGWLLGISIMALSLLTLGSAYDAHVSYAHDLPGGPDVPLQVAANLGWSAAFPTLLILMPLVFPDGNLLSRRWRPVVWLAALIMVLTLMLSLIGGGGGSGDSILATLLNGPALFIATLGLMVAAAVSLVLRYRRAGSELRHQLKWFVAAVLVAVTAVIPVLANIDRSPIVHVLSAIAFSALPASIGIAVLKYRLYDVDVVISRALLYGALALLITTVYVGIVVGIGTLIGSRSKPNLVLSIVATTVVAVGFQPVRERLQRVANRLVYGRRASPYEVLSEFSEQVAGSYAADDVLPQMARVLQEGTGADHATVWLWGETELTPAATSPHMVVGYQPLPFRDGRLPPIPDATRVVAVRHRDEILGALSVSKRAGETLTPIESKLLEDLARQAGLALKNVGLSVDLKARLDDLAASRQRIVAAQDEERRRLERTLHAGPEQHLASMKAKLRVAGALVDADSSRAEVAIDELIVDVSESLEALRDLARGIYPPVLADRGLRAALEAQAQKARIPTAVAAEGIRRYAPEVETAVYFCVLEALRNAERHAAATSVEVRIVEQGGVLTFEVKDDGRGFDRAKVEVGTGITKMSDRLDALGGSFDITSQEGQFTRVSCSLPLVEAVVADLLSPAERGAVLAG